MSTKNVPAEESERKMEKAAWLGLGACHFAVTSSLWAKPATPPLTSTSKQNALLKSLCSTRQKRPGRARPPGLSLRRPSFSPPAWSLPSCSRKECTKHPLHRDSVADDLFGPPPAGDICFYRGLGRARRVVREAEVAEDGRAAARGRSVVGECHQVTPLGWEGEFRGWRRLAFFRV